MKRIQTSFFIVIACCWCLFSLSTEAQETDAQKLLWDLIMTNLTWQESGLHWIKGLTQTGYPIQNVDTQ